MTQDDYLQYHKDLCSKALALSSRKNHDYADPDRKQDDPLAVFSNFMQCQNLGICDVESGFLVRLSDKFSRLANLLADGHERAVNDESVEDTALDIINYVCLLMAYRKAVGCDRVVANKHLTVATVTRHGPYCTCAKYSGSSWSEKYLSYTCHACDLPIQSGDRPIPRGES